MHNEDFEESMNRARSKKFKRRMSQVKDESVTLSSGSDTLRMPSLAERRKTQNVQ